jgi:hypothetical protein
MLEYHITYVDVRAVSTEGKIAAAVARRFPNAGTVFHARQNNVIDDSWDFDWRRYHNWVREKFEAQRGEMHVWGQVSELPLGIDIHPEFEVRRHSPAEVGIQKTIHAAVAYQMAKDVYAGLIRKATDAVALLACDVEYAPLVADLVNEGYRVAVHFWDEHVSPELKSAASEFVPLDLRRACLHEGWRATPIPARRPVKAPAAMPTTPVANAA